MCKFEQLPFHNLNNNFKCNLFDGQYPFRTMPINVDNDLRQYISERSIDYHIIIYVSIAMLALRYCISRNRSKHPRKRQRRRRRAKTKPKQKREQKNLNHEKMREDGCPEDTNIPW